MVRALRKKLPEISSILLFVVSSTFATFLAVLIIDSGLQSPPSSPTAGASYIVFYLLAALVFSGFVIFLGRRNLGRLLRWIFIGVIAYVVFYVWLYLGAFIAQTELQYLIIIFAAPAIMVLLMIFKNEWYVVDAAGFFLVAGVASLWGLIIGVWAAVGFLVAFAIYDYIAVYRTKHMVSLAKVAIDDKLPLLFVFPGEKGVKMKDLKMSETGEKGDQKVLFLGFGDMVFPAIMVVSSAIYGRPDIIPFMLFPLIGAIIGMGLLFFTSISKPAPGLPMINTGAVSGFLIAFLIFRIIL